MSSLFRKDREAYESWKQVDLPEVIMLGRQHTRSVTHALVDHNHLSSIEICYLSSGEQTFCIGNSHYTMHGGQVFMTQPDVVHSTGEWPLERGILYWMIINMEPRERFLGLAQPFAGRLRADLLGIERTLFDGVPRMEQELNGAFAAMQLRSTDRSVQVQRHLLNFVTDVVSCSKKQTLAEGRDFSSVISYIDKHLAEPLAVETLAEVANLSESRFKSQFKVCFGIPPAEYVMRQRVLRAKEQLLSSDESITAIAFELGFSSSQYFATVFHRHTGMTPSAYRTQRA